MVKIGEIKKAGEIGLKGGCRYEWRACIDCGLERWVTVYRNSLRCRGCANSYNKGKKLSEETRAKLSLAHRGGFQPKGSEAYNWKGGRIISEKGYVYIWISPDDFFYPMADKKGYVFEHRLVVAKALNRCLLPWEAVHHKGTRYPSDSKENKSDNRYPENLELLGCCGKHNTGIERVLRRQGKEIKILQERVTLLEAENVLLRQEANDYRNLTRC